MPSKNKEKINEAEQCLYAGIRIVRSNRVFQSVVYRAGIEPSEICPRDGWAVVSNNGRIYVHPTRVGDPAEWAYVLAHCLLHLVFNHFQESYKAHLPEWNAACDCYIAQFLKELKLGRPPLELKGLVDDLKALGRYSLRSEEKLFEDFCDFGIPASLLPTGTSGTAIDMRYEPVQKGPWYDEKDWAQCFGEGLVEAITEVVEEAASDSYYVTPSRPNTPAQRARNWFVSHYPLLGALAASFEIIEDSQVCQRMQINVAAVNMQAREIYINPRAGLTVEELRFVMAHELLHVGLRHDVRCEGRDHYLWNVACDYVINGWLKEMGVGDFPQIGGLYDPELKDESAEAIYDRIVTDLRRYRKLATMRGIGLSDILDDPGWWASKAGADLDDFYRSCLAQGLIMHQEQGRGYLSAGLIEEIRALSQPPIPWDVELAQWFDHYFPPLEKVRTYARLSRRQSATPDIPRPLWVPPPDDDNRTFGVLLDTSGSMDRALLAQALGAIASYSISRDVRAVRVVFCDAATFDQGYMAPDDIAGSVKVRGRGGTVLQPGVDLLENAGDFPKQGPLLIITDGLCDKLRIRREHAFLIPYGKSLPFPPQGKVFRMR
ncbi:MAG: peptidase [Chloroflexi bacterium]|nr:peptidase [Chloroflexota bacterium]